MSTSSTFQTFGILGSVVFGVSIWVKYLAVLHHLVLHRCRTKRSWSIRDGAWGVLCEAQTLVCRKNIQDCAYLSIGVTSGIGTGLCRVPGGGIAGVPGGGYAGSWI